MTTNSKSYNKALKTLGDLIIWLYRDQHCLGSASSECSRGPLLPDSAMQFCQTIKGLFCLIFSHAMVMVESLLKLSGLSWQAPDFSAVCRFLIKPWKEKLSVACARNVMLRATRQMCLAICKLDSRNFPRCASKLDAHAV